MVMKSNQHQIENLSKYFADTSKIIAASSVVGAVGTIIFMIAMKYKS